ncbi:membrane dipeptidase-domain-containing protein [Schizophyllum amplum]|uniref:Dipeptidase n=1 Tax=Schizophyllum amplum TaxID=97359 RepID=A0A550CSJ5_9AGAR|nr:membrane dipeptidase-domain-containing protein [Auriculariopsis ampla]
MSSESFPLLRLPSEGKPKPSKARAVIWAVVTVVFAAAVVLLTAANAGSDTLRVWLGMMPHDADLAAGVILKSAPVIDGHIDLPWLVRMLFKNDPSKFDLEEMPYHVDITRLRQGSVGGFFWSVYTPCPDPNEEGPDYVNATLAVRDTMEQIDLSKVLIDKYSDTFELATTAADVKQAIRSGKIASLLGIEGAHQISASIGTLRQFHELGVRYMTLTHTCNNPFADSCGIKWGGIEPRWHGLNPALGPQLVREMNRLGMFVDLSHTSDETAKQAIALSEAPVIWSHSSARAVHNHPRNVPDDILELIGEGEGKKDGVVMVNFAPGFVGPTPEEADIESVSRHVEHLAKVMGRKHVGLGSDFDGIETTPIGLEDVSKYPALISLLYSRGWSKYDLAGLTGGNLLRVMEGMERVSAEMQRKGVAPAMDVYDRRPDL